jgi:hypothetical protein
MRKFRLICSFLFAVMWMCLSSGSFAQVGISVAFGPPALPVYDQPNCPEDGYLWTPGYWAYADEGYYWVPGTWVQAPQAGFLWTPGYWGWGGSAFLFHEGYWGPQVGYYGGINYGYGYGGHGYEGGRWENNHFYYNTSVNRVNSETFHNTYNTRVENINASRVSYNGGTGGVNARPTAQENTYDKESHTGPVAAQNQHMEEARSNPESRASANEGKPAVAATSKPGDFKAGAEPAKEAGAPYKAPEHAATTNEAHESSKSAVAPTANNHASELQPHKYVAPVNENAATQKKNQAQQDKLATKQNQEHQQLEQQQAKEHQQAAKKNTSESQKQQMEQRHTQQTQQLEQKHTTQQQKVEAHQQPHQAAPQSHPPAEKEKP